MDTETCHQKSEDFSIQCELLSDGLHGRVYDFDIVDSKLRRKLVRRIYFLEMLEIALVMPCLEITLRLAIPYNELYVRLTFFLVLMLVYTLLYKWPNWRRCSPFNYLVFLFITLTCPISRSLYLISMGQTHWLHAYPLILIVELLALVLYSKQRRFKFTHGMGFIIIYVVFGLLLVLAYFLNMLDKLLAVWSCTLEAWYIIYDTHLMLCGRHGYNVRPGETLFAVSNIHIDLPKFLWLLIKHFVFGPIIVLKRIIQDCRTNEIC